MEIIKRSGEVELFAADKLERALKAASLDLPQVDPERLVERVLPSLTSTESTDTRSVALAVTLAAAEMGTFEPEYDKFAGRYLISIIDKDVASHGITKFSESIKKGHAVGLISDSTAEFVKNHAEELDNTINPARSWHFKYHGANVIRDRYLLRHPTKRTVLETPQMWLLRVACGLANDIEEAKTFYETLSSLVFLPGTPTLFNSGTTHSQLASCYLVDSPQDSLKDIYDAYAEVAQLSKWAGGIGIEWSRVRSRGSLIAGTNGESSGLIPWLNTLDASVASVNQGGKRKGAACVYLPTWHADIQNFLELRDNTGPHEQRTYNLNLANWIPDEFMRRVSRDEMWSLFDPNTLRKAGHTEFSDLTGDDFTAAYIEAEKDGLAASTVPARVLYARMMRTLAETGNGWMCFSDTVNRRANQVTKQSKEIVHLSNLCTEIVEVTNKKETAVCTLGSVNIARHLNGDHTDVDYEKLAQTVTIAVTMLNRAIDRNFYSSAKAERSQDRWRNIGIGIMGLQDAFFLLGLPFDSDEARTLSTRISEEIYFAALTATSKLAELEGPCKENDVLNTANGLLHFDFCKDVVLTDPERWKALKKQIAKKTGVRNSLLIAIAPTATIATISGVNECVEPQVSNLLRRETLSGDHVLINQYLVSDLQKAGLWDQEMYNAIKNSNGSIQDIERISPEIKELYKTAWELSQKSLIAMAIDRGAFIDQSQSLNFFVESPTVPKLSSMYMHAWLGNGTLEEPNGVKTTYYLRSRPRTEIGKVVQAASAIATPPVQQEAYSEAEGIACSLENPETCEACT